MLVLSRQSGMFTDISISREKLEEALASGKSEVKMRFRVYNITVDGKRSKRGDSGATVDIAFDDDDRNFTIERPERKITGVII